MAALSALAITLWPAPALPIGRMGTALLVADALALVLLGPGAYSVDALLFGRREIVIPHESHGALP